jgi:hypothetical protein
VIFIKVQETLQEVLFAHELLSSIPPVVLLLLGIVFLGSPLCLPLAHHTDSMEHSLDRFGWLLEMLDLVNVSALDCIERLLRLFENRKSLS